MKFFVYTFAVLFATAAAAPHKKSHTTALPTTIGETPAPRHECVGQKDGELVGDKKNKSIFYECLSNGLAYRFHCPRGLIFSRKDKACTFDPDNPVTVPPPKTSSKFDCTKRKDGFYEDRHDPTKFHECANGLASDFDCPKGTVFEEKRQVCVYDDDWKERTHEVEKTTESVTVETTVITTEGTTTEEDDDDTTTVTTQGTTTEEDDDETTTVTTQGTTTEEDDDETTTVTAEVSTTTEETLPTESFETTTKKHKKRKHKTTTQEPTTTDDETTEEPTTTEEVVNPFDPEKKATRGHHTFQ